MPDQVEQDADTVRMESAAVEVLRQFVAHDKAFENHRDACGCDPCLTCQAHAAHEVQLYSVAEAIVRRIDGLGPISEDGA